ncbi:MAG: hypothetical protein ACKVIH_04070 [Burkholderiales bacterium]|mgnify:CR=1 FL=1
MTSDVHAFAHALATRNLNALALQPGPLPSRRWPDALAPANLHQRGGYGPGYIAGTVKVLTAPVARRVALFDQRSLLLLQTTMSAADGAYRFNNLQLGRNFLAVALDDANNTVVYNAAVADLVQAGIA